MNFDDLPYSVPFENQSFTVIKLSLEEGYFERSMDSSVFKTSYNTNTDHGDGMLVIINGFAFSIMWGNARSVFLYNSHGWDIHGRLSNNGTAVLIQFK